MNKLAHASVILALALAPVLAQADETAEQRIAVLASFALVDYSQSVDMLFQNSGYHELNPVLGPNPSKIDMALFGAVGVGLTYLLGEVLPPGWSQIAIDSVVATERLNIEDNRLLYKGWNTDGPPLRGRTMTGIPIVVSMKF